MKTTLTRKSRAAAGKPRMTAARQSEVIDLVPALLKIKSILVPVDFSDTSRKALHYAIRMAEQFGSKITVINVVEPIVTPDLAYHPLMLEPEKAKEAAAEKLATFCEQMRLPPAVIEKTLVRYGTPFAEITDAARSLKVDLIILTTHGYTGLKHVFLGSTAERVVRHAPCPVLTVREKEHEFV